MAKVNRAKLGAIVFNEPKKLENLEQILSPLIYREITHRARGLEKTGQIYFVDIPLYFEKRQIYAKFDKSVLVFAPTEILVRRIMARNGLDEKSAKNRLALQIDIEKKREMANFVVDNSKDLANLQMQMEKFLKKINAK